MFTLDLASKWCLIIWLISICYWDLGSFCFLLILFDWHIKVLNGPPNYVTINVIKYCNIVQCFNGILQRRAQSFLFLKTLWLSAQKREKEQVPISNILILNIIKVHTALPGLLLCWYFYCVLPSISFVIYSTVKYSKLDRFSLL